MPQTTGGSTVIVDRLSCALGLNTLTIRSRAAV
jgi:hypothetical protein